MAKTETNVSTLKINRGTYAKVQENLSSITENELIITSDKNVPIPTTSDNGKAVVVNASGEYELGNIPTPHTINTYTAGTLSEADQAKIADDITNNYPIRIGQFVYNLFAGAETNVVTFVTILTGYFNESLNSSDYYIATYNKTTHNLSVQNQSSNHYYIPIHSLLFNFSDTSGTVTTKMIAGGQSRVFGAMSIYVTTTAPTADNTDGGIRIVKLTSEPSQRFNGWWYIILSQSNASNDIGGSNGGTR